MKPADYNYADFDIKREQPSFDDFPSLPLRPGTRAPSFALEELDTGASIEMKSLWREGLVIIEFGSFT